LGAVTPPGLAVVSWGILLIFLQEYEAIYKANIAVAQYPQAPRGVSRRKRSDEDDDEEEVR
jgi:serine/threonine/tyrosine-interacting protein